MVFWLHNKGSGLPWGNALDKRRINCVTKVRVCQLEAEPDVNSLDLVDCSASQQTQLYSWHYLNRNQNSISSFIFF